MRTASIRPLPVAAFAFALACVAMVPVAHAGVRVWMDDSWDTCDATVSQSADREYCLSRTSVHDDYRPHVVVRYVVIHSRAISDVTVVLSRYSIQRVEAGNATIGVGRTVVPAPARAFRTERSRVVSTSRWVNQVKRASFEARQAGPADASKRPQKVSAKQQGAPVRVASKSAK